MLEGKEHAPDPIVDIMKRMGLFGTLSECADDEPMPLGSFMDEAIANLEAPDEDLKDLQNLAGEGSPETFEVPDEDKILNEYVDEMLSALRPSLLDQTRRLNKARELPERYAIRIDAARKHKQFHDSLKVSVKAPSSEEEQAEFPLVKAEQDVEATVARTCRYSQQVDSVDPVDSEATSTEYNDVEKHPVPYEQPRPEQTNMPHIYCP